MPVTFGFANTLGDNAGARSAIKSVFSTTTITTTTTTSLFFTPVLTPGGMQLTSMGNPVSQPTSTMNMNQNVNTNTFSTTFTTAFGASVLNFDSVQSGVGLPGNTMSFTLTPLSSFYNMAVNNAANPGAMVLANGGTLPAGASFSLAFTAGNGLNALSNFTLSRSFNGTGSVLIAVTTTGGLQLGFSTGSFGATGPFSAEKISSIAFVITGQGTLTINSIGGNLACFGRGTNIATPEGGTPVEDLRIGDEILTADGKVTPVKWIGRKAIDTKFGIPERLRPVRIKAGALDGARPCRDLVLTADHALLLDDVLYEAGALVGSTGIAYDTPETDGEQFTVYHIETEDHAVILAENTPAETFIDYVGRQIFDNYRQYLKLYGEPVAMEEAPYPRVSRSAQAAKVA